MITLFILPVLPVKPAIPIVMGTNVGTTVTNTIISLAQLTERNEFRRAFAGAVVHDIFNWLSVLVLLPLEVITGYLRRLTGLIIKDLHLSEGKKTNQKLLKVVTKPLTKLIIQTDKKVITKIALGKTDGKDKSLIKNCKTEEISASRVGEETNQTRNVTIITEKDTCSFLFEGTKMSDTAVGVILLVVTLAILMPLCCLKFIVKILHSMLRSRLAKIVKMQCRLPWTIQIPHRLPGQFGWCWHDHVAAVQCDLHLGNYTSHRSWNHDLGACICIDVGCKHRNNRHRYYCGLGIQFKSR